jgi:hypothetical protein
MVVNICNSRFSDGDGRSITVQSCSEQKERDPVRENTKKENRTGGGGSSSGRTMLSKYKALSSSPRARKK